MERFVKLTPAQDPSLWETKKALRELGFQEGSLQDLDSVLNEAAITAAGVLRRAGQISVVAAPGSI
jgi:hypothetical protein